MKTIVYNLIYEGKEPVVYKKNISDDLFTFLTSPPGGNYEEVTTIKFLRTKVNNLTSTYWDVMYDIVGFFLRNELTFDKEEIEFFDVDGWSDNEIFVEVSLY
jgi:hypothetical protein